MDRRRHERFSRRLQVRYWPHGLPEREKIGYTKDLSEGGAFLVTPKPLKKGSRVQLEVGPEESAGFLLEAVVARSVPVPRELQAKGIKTSGMGLRFLRVRELLYELLPRATGAPFGAEDHDAETPAEIHDTGSAPRLRGVPSARPTPSSSKRATRLGSPAATPPDAAEEPAEPLEAEHRNAEKPETEGSAKPPSPATTSSTEDPAQPRRSARSRAYVTESWPEPRDRARAAQVERGAKTKLMRYPVTFPSLEVFLRSWDRDLRYGGLFVSTTQPARLDSEVELELQLPESETVLRVRAQVVHVHAPDSRSSEANLLSGMGVQFENAEVLRTLARFAESMR